MEGYTESEITGLVRFDAAKAALEIATSVDEVVEIRNKAEAFRAYAKQAHLSLGMQNQCAEIKVRAERRAGELLIETQLDKGGRPNKNLSQSASGLFKLDDIGIDKDQSSRWQAIASIPEEIFEEHIKGTVEAEKELTSAGLLNVARDIKCKQRQEERKEAILRETLSAEESGIYCSDCIKFMKDHMADGTVDLTITSPPYDHLRSYEIYTFDFEAIAQELFRITKDGGVLVWIAGDAVVNSSETGSSFRQALYFMEVGFSLWDTMIYQKAATSYPSIGRYQQIFEYMFVLSKNRPKAFNPICDVPKLWEGSWGHTTRRRQDGSLDTQTIKEGNELKMRSNIWRYHNGKGMGTRDDLVVLHPASFPEKLAEDHILSWSNPGDLVFDPMCGSGTTLKMASSNNRKFLGIDVCEEYCQIARKRIAAMDGPK